MNAPANIKAQTLANSLVAAFSEMEGAIKDKVNPAFKSKYADLTSVIEAIRPVLAKHDLAFTQHPKPADNGVCVETVLHHANGEHMSLGMLFVPANKQDAQGFGSALTYARRYALVTAFGVPVEDDDGNAAAKSSGAAKSAPPRDAMPDAEWARIVSLIEATKTDAGRMLKNYGINDLRQLDQQQYAEAIGILEDRLAKMAKSDSNREAAHA